MAVLDDALITTIAACSTALAVIMCIAVLLSSARDGLVAARWWVFAPFGLAVPAGILLTWPDLLPDRLGLRLGWYGLMLVHGSVWNAARVSLGRQARPWAVLLPCTAVLLFNATVGADGVWPEIRVLPRVLLFALYNALAAREFWRPGTPQLPAATTLRWILTSFAAYNLVRSPVALMLPAPLGAGEPAVWSIALFNFALVLEGLLLGVFLTALRREQVAAGHLRLAMVDPLTGVGNRRALDAALAELAGTPEAEGGGTAALAVFDIDCFKLVNDELGHPFGDLVIAGAAQVAGELFGPAHVYRTGGEEFAVLFRASTLPAALQRAENLRRAFAMRSHADGGVTRRCTISVGLAVARPEFSPPALLASADEALYAAKRSGRNRTIMAGIGRPVAVVPAGAEPERRHLRRAAAQG